MTDQTPPERTRQNRRRTDREPSSDATRPVALAVDDDASYLKLLVRQLEALGFSVVSATDGEAAIALCATHDPDLLVLDYQMPGLDGFETLDRVRAISPQPYSILLTANESLNLRIEAFSRGFDDFITKTAGNAEILGKLNSARRMLSLQRRLKEENSELMRIAVTDQLTGLSNRLYLFSRARAIAAAQLRLNVIVFDLAGFAEINGTYGQLFGDRILADVGALFRQNVRSTDVVSRLGGDEFVLLVPDEDESLARGVAGRLGRAIEQLEWKISGDTVRVRCRWGLASAVGRELSFPELLAACDRSLTEAHDQER